MNPMTNVNQGQPYYGKQLETVPAAFYAVPVYYSVNAMSRAMPVDPQIAPGWSDLRKHAEPIRHPVPQPVVYVDIPDAGTNDSPSKIPSDTRNFERDNMPVVYIDLPGHNKSITVKNGEREGINSAIDGSRITPPGIQHMYLDRPYPNPIAESHKNIHGDVLCNRKPSIPDIVYIDIPNSGTAGVIDESGCESAGTSTTSSRQGTLNLRRAPTPTKTTINNDDKDDPEDTPVVYIDFPEQGSSTTVQRGTDRFAEATNSSSSSGYATNSSNGSDFVHTSTTSSRQGTLNLRRAPIPSKTTINNDDKDDPEDTPVVYIDFPEQGSSTTVQRGTDRFGEVTNGSSSSGYATNSSNESDLIKETIFFDQFKNKRIEVGQSKETPHPEPTNVQPELTLKTQFPYATHLGSVYPSSTSADTEPMTPITEHPKPPPAYSEIDTPPPPYPRTEVIVPNNQNAIGMARSDRKLVNCPYCSRSVHTLTVRENAFITHIIAVLFLLIFIPFAIMVYCTDYFKYRNHYCPNCNKLIGYEIPMFCQGMTYTKPV